MAVKIRVDTITKDNAKDAKEEAHFAYVQLYDVASGKTLEETTLSFDSGDIASLVASVKNFRDKYVAKNSVIDGLKAAVAVAISEMEKGA